MSFLSLIWARSFSCANGPDWLVSNDNITPVLSELTDGIELSLIDFLGLIGFSLINLLSNAGNDLQLVFQSKLHLLPNQLVRFTEDVSSL
eukprot:CAMPEP_0170556974 /NCGR_PEP_ID=MMETSP0211-20121228/19099_1 /TAXON_ID=311385 /ORGANISM="Pseudokeronopsis sp., Strain OXSARD2" /LENGTH=89 /DNA_ID=CAMNT_0010867623 /DNA_START=213 /DNA_END=482 /DNA_ORIENTATION=-